MDRVTYALWSTSTSTDTEREPWIKGVSSQDLESENGSERSKAQTKR